MSKPTVDLTCKPPSAPTFSFTAPFPPKQRRVSLALPSSPRLVPAWSFRDDTSLDSHVAETSKLVPEKKGKMRKIADGEDVEPTEKKQRKKWTMEETQMLVDGCNIWGVGNWKAILKDPSLKFDNRSPVDLKDRFRTYFPDAYKQHYPNARTHLSSKVRSTLPDGTSLFEKTRSKKRRPFTEEEDRALKAGYEKHGTVWATIVKDPIFQEQNRRSTDLRDRFRNAFPELYQAAGYKPRNTSKKKKSEAAAARLPVRAATDDHLATSSTSAGPIRRRRAHTTQGWLRGGTKSVPQSTACSEDEDSSGGEEEMDTISKVTTTETAMVQTEDPFTEVEMETMDPLSEPLSIPDFVPNSSQSLSEIPDSSQSQMWSANVEAHNWSTGSPTSPDYFLNHSPFSRRDGTGMIGKSAWGTQDWFSANPRLDPSSVSSSSSSYVDGMSPIPSSPFSFHALNHGVLDRYDLFPTSFPHDFASEVGVGDSHSTFSDPEMFAPSSFRGFTHHSNYAGDLIFGARTHQPQPAYGSGFGFGVPALGLSGVPQSTGIHPMQLHTPALPGIDEIELTSITLSDHIDAPHDAMEDTVDVGVQKDDPESTMSLSQFSLSSHSLDDSVHELELHSTPPATPVTTSRPLRAASNIHHVSSSHGRSISVPPSEFRGGMSRAPPAHANSQPLPRSGSFFHSAHQLHHGTPFDTELLSTSTSAPSSDLYDLPFLDLHYYASNHSSVNLAANDDDARAESNSSRQGQALDLAQTSFSAKQGPPSLGQQITQSFASTAGRVHSLHHRGQSSVSPQDLLLRKGSDNKRKRASWDGGMC